ncbi:MAG: nucleotide exchange factor GrpE [Pseudomonadota bacterium]
MTQDPQEARKTEDEAAEAPVDPTLAAAEALAEAQASSDPAPDAASDPGGAAPAEDDPALRLAEVEAERDALKDQLLRALADNENVRKRAERDVKEARAYGGAQLARDLLAVYDNLARALDSADDDMRAAAGPVLEGVDLTLRELVNAFEKHAIVQVDPAVGDRFDAQLHQAMFEAPAPGAEPGAVIQVMQAGFTISGRLLRPAMVGVAAAAPADAAPAEAVSDPAPEQAQD